MSKSYRALSHYERTHNPSFCSFCDVPIREHCEYVHQSVTDENLQRVITKTVKKVVDRKSFNHLKVSDFALENMQAINATLNPCSLSHDVHTAQSNIERQLEAMSNKLNK